MHYKYTRDERERAVLKKIARVYFFFSTVLQASASNIAGRVEKGRQTHSVLCDFVLSVPQLLPPIQNERNKKNMFDERCDIPQTQGFRRTERWPTLELYTAHNSDKSICIEILMKTAVSRGISTIWKTLSHRISDACEIRTKATKDSSFLSIGNFCVFPTFFAVPAIHTREEGSLLILTQRQVLLHSVPYRLMRWQNWRLMF